MKNLLPRSGLLFNLYFVIFLLFLHDPLLSAVNKSFFGDEKIITLGIILVLAIILDFVGTLIKIPRIYARANYQEANETGSIILPLWLGRTTITIMLVGMASEAFGNTLNGDSPTIQILVFALVLKEIFIMGFMIMKSEAAWKTAPDKLKEYSWKEFLADSMLWLYMSIAYTACWESIGLNDPLRTYSGGALVTYIIAATVLFMLIVMPLRAVYLIEEVIAINTTKQRVAWCISTGLMLAAALWQIY